MTKEIFAVQVFGQEVPVIAKKNLTRDLEDGTLAYYDTEDEVIIFDWDLPLDDFIVALGHEMVHVVYQRLNLIDYSAIEEMNAHICTIPIFENLEVSLCESQLESFLSLQPSEEIATPSESPPSTSELPASSAQSSDVVGSVQ